MVMAGSGCENAEKVEQVYSLFFSFLSLLKGQTSVSAVTMWIASASFF